MARIVGNSREYRFALIDADGNPRPEHSIGFPSVTTVIKGVLGGPSPEWGFKVALDGVAQLVADGISLRGADTEALKALLKEAGETPWSKRDAGAQRGNRVHNYLELCVAAAQEKRDLPVPEDGYESAVLGWWQERNPKILATEAVLVSVEHRFAGSVDLVWSDEVGRVVITDLKTHKPARGRHPAYVDDRLQVGAYALAWNEMHPESFSQHQTVLVACEDGTWKEDERGGLPDAFLHLLRLYRSMKEVA